LDPNASKEPTFENLLMLHNGRIQWRAKLREMHDPFVEFD
jgi:hypothetical protein